MLRCGAGFDSCYVGITRLEDRALLGSNPSAKPGVVTLEDLDIFHDFQVSFCCPAFQPESEKPPGGLGGGVPQDRALPRLPTLNSEEPVFLCICVHRSRYNLKKVSSQTVRRAIASWFVPSP